MSPNTKIDKEELEKTKQKIRKRIEKYVQISGYKLNPDKEIVETIIQGLAVNLITHGYAFCPCRILEGDMDKDRQKICPCKWHKDEIAQDGFCHCCLYFKK
ncbi:ferredoxin-thioredoxin reductase catalytic domain-containing protein [bacterium]